MRETPTRLRPEEELALTIADCDSMLATLRRRMHLSDGDPEAEALTRHEIDRWLDRRLAVMGRFPEP